MTSYIGLGLLLIVFGAIALVGRATSRNRAAYWKAIKDGGFTPSQLPNEWLADYGFLNAMRGRLLEGRPDALLLMGHRSGTPVSTGTGQIPC